MQAIHWYNGADQILTYDPQMHACLVLSYLIATVNNKKSPEGMTQSNLTLSFIKELKLQREAKVLSSESNTIDYQKKCKWSPYSVP